MLVLSGILVVIVGFVAGFNPLLVVTVAGFVTGLSAGINPITVLGDFGHAFITSRFVALIWLVVPVVGLLERAGLRERAQMLIGNVQAATTGRLLLLYLLLRQVTAALGLTSLGGHAQMVRPLIAPMAEAAEEKNGPIVEDTRMLIRANAAAADNIGALLRRGYLPRHRLDPAHQRRAAAERHHRAADHLSLWAIPTAIMTFIIHGTRLLLLDRRLKRAREVRS